MRRTFVALASAAALLLAAVQTVPAAPFAAAPGAEVDGAFAIVQLAGDPLATSPRTKPEPGRRIDFSSTAVRSERARLAAIRNDFRQWLRTNAPAAKITREFDIAVNAVGVELNGTSIDRLRSAPMVRFAELQGLYGAVAHDDPDLGLVNALAGWTAAGGEADAGAGVKVAVIDSGIDVAHPCFDDTGYPAQAQDGPPELTNNKVIVAKVFSNAIKKNAFTPVDDNSHGTHVAGTIACNAHTPAVVEGVDIPYDPSGVAPRALLGNYNVFPGDSGSARSEDIIDALEEAYEDGFDVANMSLGGARNDGGGAFLLTHAIDNLDRANMVVAVAGGNEGPGYFTVHYPGAAVRALTAGASSVGHSVVRFVEAGGELYEYVLGQFGSITTDVTAPLRVVPGTGFPHGLATACDGGPALPDLTGTIALLGRGTCDFTVKMRNAQNAGAVAVIMVDRTEEPPFVMAHNGLEPQPTIPGVMVRLSAGLEIDDHDGENVTLRSAAEYVHDPADDNQVASFSSWGPTHGDLLIKPDVVAPGHNIISSIPEAFCDPVPPEGCWGFLSGTSMATPHLAGAAAVVRGAHPTWSAAQIRSAVVNTAQEGVLRHPLTNTVTDDVQIVGTGLLDLGAATTAVAALDPVSQSFGSIARGSGAKRSATVTLTNLGAAAVTFTVAVADTNADGVLFATSGGSGTLAAGASRSFTVSVTSSKGAPEGHHQAFLRVSIGGTEVAHAALYVLVGSGDRAPGQHQLPPPFA